MEYVRGNITKFWWDNETKTAMSNNAGFFPATTDLLIKFCKLMIEDVKQVDILGSGLKEEKLINNLLLNAVKLRLPDLYSTT